MTILKERIHNIVEVFYQPNFKTFYINSEDGETAVKPVGVFVSLGITTSPQLMQQIRSSIEETSGCKAYVAEIISRRNGFNQYINWVGNKENPQQFRMSDSDLPENVMNQEQAEAKLAELEASLVPGKDVKELQRITVRASILREMMKKLSGSSLGWSQHSIQELENGSFIIYHLYLNYMKDEESGLEHRIGIVVEE